MLIDSHCHLDFDELAHDMDGVLTRMKASGVSHCVTISTRVERFAEIRAITEKYDNVWCSVGTHPHNAHEELHITADQLARLSEHPKCIAIGEAGLDYFYDNSPRKAQKSGFVNHIAAARKTGLPLVIHARDADADMADILQEESRKGEFPFVLHCFSSGEELARTGLELGGYLSFSGIITFKNARQVLEIAKKAPLERILVETDAPYLAPVPHRGKVNEPAHVIHTARHLAEARNISQEELAATTSTNFFRLFSKASKGPVQDL